MKCEKCGNLLESGEDILVIISAEMDSTDCYSAQGPVRYQHEYCHEDENLLKECNVGIALDGNSCFVRELDGTLIEDVESAEIQMQAQGATLVRMKRVQGGKASFETRKVKSIVGVVKGE